MNYLIILAIVPVIALLAYIYKKDTHKEPWQVLIRTFFLGIATIIPAAILEILLGPIFPTEVYTNLTTLFINTLIGVALIEEIVKWLVIKITIYKANDFDETFDGIIYAVFASLGFACLENIIYVINQGLVTGLLRAVTAVPLHACTGIVMGYFIGKAKLNEKNNKTKETTSLILSLLIPTIAHAIYDFLIFSGRITIIWLIFTIGLYIICFIIVRISSKRSQAINESLVANNEVAYTQNTAQPNIHNFCTNCGQPINNSNFCPNCGKKKE